MENGKCYRYVCGPIKIAQTLRERTWLENFLELRGLVNFCVKRGSNILARLGMEQPRYHFLVYAYV